MKFLETYNQFIGQGGYNQVFDLDDNWVLKTPLTRKNDENVAEYYDDMKSVLSNFDHHIKTMQKYPEFFPKVKRLDKRRAAIEKMDTDKAIKETKHIYYYMKRFLKNYTHGSLFGAIRALFIEMESDKNLLSKLNDGDKICKKWYNFLNKLFNSSLVDHEVLDIHYDNVGLDKNGNIKLIDF